MSNAQRHIIGQILLEVETRQPTEVWGVQEELSQLLQQVAIPQIEQLFDRWTGTDEVVRLDQLVIELPAIAPHHLADEFVPKLLTTLQQALDDLPRPIADDTRQPFTDAPAFADRPSLSSESEPDLLAQALPEANWEVLLYFLEYGRLPWWQPSEPLSTWVLRWQAVIQSDISWRVTLQRLIANQPLAGQRLVSQLPAPFRQQLIMRMQPAWIGFQGLLDSATALMRSLSLDDRITSYLEQQAWIVLFAKTQTNISLNALLPVNQWLQMWLPLLCNAAIAAGTTPQQVRNLIAARSFPERDLWLEVMDQILSSELSAPVDRMPASAELTVAEQLPLSEQRTDLESIAPVDSPPFSQGADVTEVIAPFNQAIASQQTTEGPAPPPSEGSTALERPPATEPITRSEQSTTAEQETESAQTPEAKSVAPSDPSTFVERISAPEELTSSEPSTQLEQIDERETITPANPLTLLEHTDGTDESTPLQQLDALDSTSLTEAIVVSEQSTGAEQTTEVSGEQDTEPYTEPEVIAASESLTSSDLLPPSEQSLTSASLTAAELPTGSEPIPSIDPLPLLEGTDTTEAIAPLAQDQIEPPSQGLHPLMTNPPRYTVYVSLSPAERANGIYLNHAGLVLLHPFLTYYFEAIGLVSENAFCHEYAQQIAIVLLHYLATGETSAPEYDLVLPKLLCGWPLNDPVVVGLELPEAALAEAENLLETVIRYWEVLKNTSPDGLRQGFLQRQGKLTQAEMGGWKLRVEQQSIDILLTRLPWGVSMVKLPWMAEVLVVEWM